MKIIFAIIPLLLSITPVNAENQGSILAADTGRYVAGQISTSRKDQYLLDTETGKIWQFVETKEGLIQLQPIGYIAFTGDIFDHPPSDEEANEARNERLRLIPKKEKEMLKEQLGIDIDMITGKSHSSTTNTTAPALKDR